MDLEEEEQQYFHVLYFNDQASADAAQAQLKESHDPYAWQDTDHEMSNGNPMVKFLTDYRILWEERFALEKQTHASRGVWNDQC